MNASRPGEEPGLRAEAGTPRVAGSLSGWGRLRELDRLLRSHSGRYRRWLLTEIALAVPPAVTVVIAFIATGYLTQHPILFASLASSAFLIYREPSHRMNRIRVMLVAQLVGWTVGSLAALLFGAGYLAAGAAMTVSIILLVALNVLHPPAISTSLGFALLGPKDTLLETFLLALFMVAILAVLQRTAVWAVRRMRGEPVEASPVPEITEG